MHRVQRLALLAGIALAAVVTDAAAGTLTDDIRIESKTLGYALQYRVYVPDGAWYLEQGRMKAVLDEMIVAGRIEPVIAVFVDARDPESRTILGLSFGGLNAACFGLSIPQTFSNLAMQSPASGEMLRVVGEQYRRILEDKGYPVTYLEVPQGHNWNNWGPLLPEVLAAFFGRR